MQDELISRQAVEDKLVKLCDSLEEIFANIRMENQDESVCGLCEYDCPAPFECKGFETNECFKLAYEIRHKWQSTKDLPPVNPQPKTGHWIRCLIRNEKGGCIGAKMICSKCGNDNKHDEYMNYCPNCGKKMDERREVRDKV